MNLKWLGIATGAVLVAALLLYSANRPGHQDDANTPLLAGIDLGAVSGIEITAKDQALTLVRGENGWTIASHAGAPVKPSRLRRLLLDLGGLRRVEPKTGDPALQDRLGLGEAGDRLSLEVDGVMTGLHLGKPAGGGAERRFARLDAEPQSWVVEGRLDLGVAIDDWAELSLPTLAGVDVRRIVITGAGGERLEVSRPDPDADFILADAKPGERAAQVMLNGLADSLRRIDYDDLKPVAAVDFAGALTSRFEAKSGLILDFRLVERDGQWWLAVEATADADASDDAKRQAEPHAGLAGWAFAIPAYKAEQLGQRRAALLEHRD